MLFWTVVLFISYSLTYFVVSQKKIKSLRKNNAELSLMVEYKTLLLHKAKKGSYENELAD